MTCELCGKSRMDVNTWQIPAICKVNACVPCMRATEEVIQKIMDTAQENAKAFIDEAIRVGKTLGDNK